MRICGGKYRGRLLCTPTSDDIRPTSDKVRQAVFNMLESRNLVQGATVLDGFCGTGALGLEALSRNARFCIFFDKDRNSIKTCTQNVEKLNVQDNCQILCADTTQLKKRTDASQKANLIFLDPPYHQGLITKAICSIEEGNWAEDTAVYILESEKNIDQLPPEFLILQEKIYKDTRIIIAQKRMEIVK